MMSGPAPGPRFLIDDDAWAAFQERDQSLDRTLIKILETTGNYSIARNHSANWFANLMERCRSARWRWTDPTDERYAERVAAHIRSTRLEMIETWGELPRDCRDAFCEAINQA